MIFSGNDWIPAAYARGPYPSRLPLPPSGRYPYPNPVFDSSHYVTYRSPGRIDTIDGKYVTYDSWGRIDKIGNEYVTYDSWGRIDKIGNKYVYHDIFGKTEF